MGNALVSMLRDTLKNILKSEAAERVICLIVSVFFKIPMAKVTAAVDSVREFILAAAETFPQSGTGAQKWDWVWARCKETLAEFIEMYGEQAMELIVLFVLKALTQRGEKT